MIVPRQSYRIAQAVDATTQIVAVICTQMLDLAHKLWFSMDKWVIIGAAEEAQ